jgi:hypothetical protein
MMSHPRDPSILSDNAAILRRAQAERAEVIRHGVEAALRWVGSVSRLIARGGSHGAPQRGMHA